MTKGSPEGPELAQLRQSIRHLRKAKVELDELDDRFSALIPEVEALLASLKLGVSIFVWLEQNDGTDWEERIEFRRHGKDWRLWLVGFHPSGDESARLLTDTDRSTRLQAFEKLPELLTNAAKQVDEMIAERQRLVGAVGAVMGVLKEEVES
jgi:hypothetical protein